VHSLAPAANSKSPPAAPNYTGIPQWVHLSCHLVRLLGAGMPVDRRARINLVLPGNSRVGFPFDKISLDFFSLTVGPWTISAVQILSGVWHKIGHSSLSPKSQMKLTY
jgi:hypothetical protein